ncbi:hypothetical protein D3C81_1797020 [compost metagenome]
MMHALLARPAVEADLTLRRFHAALHAGHVAAGAEALAVAGEHQGADGLVSRHALQRVDEFRAHVVAHGVALVGAVKGEQRDAGFNLQFNQGIVVHGPVRFRVSVFFQWRVQSAVMLASLMTWLQRWLSALT